MPLQDCIQKAGKALDAATAEQITATAVQYQRDGADAASAERQAVLDYMGSLDTELDSIASQAATQGVQPAMVPDSDLMRALASPNVQEAMAAIEAARETSTMEGREVLRGSIADTLHEQFGYADPAQAPESVPAERKALLILGPPGAGKSFLQREKAADWALLDSDEAKTLIPEFDGGRQANAVHVESKMIAADIRDQFLAEGLNVVQPIVGHDRGKVDSAVARLQQAGYDVEVDLVHVSPQKSLQRVMERFERTGRFIPPDYVVNMVSDKPMRVFRDLVNEGVANAENAYTTENDQTEAYELPGEDDAGSQLAGQRLRASVQAAKEKVGTPQTPLPLRSTGNVELVHYSTNPNLTTIDPAAHGRGLPGGERRRKANNPNLWVDRSYYGIGVGTPGGYVKEPRLGSEMYVTSVGRNDLYDYAADPLNLKAKAREMGSGDTATTAYEMLIRDAGFKGYYVQHPSMGTVAAVFERLLVENRGQEPKATITAYKLMKVKKGKLYRLYEGKPKVDEKSSAVPMNMWIPAEERRAFIGGKYMALRTGQHAMSVPLFPQGKTNVKGEERVWVEVELPADENWQGSYDAEQASIVDRQGNKIIPVGGYYQYENPNPTTGMWNRSGKPEVPAYVGGAVRLKRILDDSDVAEVLRREGYSEEIIETSMRGRPLPELDSSYQQRPETVYQQSALDLRGDIRDASMTVAEVQEFLQERAETKDPDSPEDFAAVVDDMVAEIEFQTGQENNGLNWYTEDVADAFDVSQRMFPTLSSGTNRQLLAIIAALNSPQNDATQNWVDALDAYEQFEQTGEVPTLRQNGKQYGTEAVQKAMASLNHMVQTMGTENAVEWLTTPHTIKELREMKASTGQYAGKGSGLVAGKMADVKLGAHMFGPKVGPFFLDVMGMPQEEVTVDLWMTRTWTRLIGAKIVDQPGKMRPAINRAVAEAAERTGLEPNQAQAVLWFFEQELYNELGSKTKPESFSKGARRVAERRGLEVPEFGRGSSPGVAAPASPAEFVLNQPPRDRENRGYIAISPNRQMRIGLLENRDLSTFIHESGHAYLEMLRDDVADLSALDELTETQQRLLDDADIVLKWLGAKSWDEVTREQHEKFARGYEMYLGEGKAPSIGLRRAFARFRTWMLIVYQQLTGLNVNLTRDVRGVFDRMLATDEEIAAAEAEAEVAPMFTDAVSAGMTEAEFKNYQRKLEDASREARERVEQGLIREWRRETAAEWRQETARIVERITGELQRSRDYIADSTIRRGKMPDGSPAPANLKLNGDEVKAVYADQPEIIDQMRRKQMYKAKGGANLKEAAAALGYANGHEMVEAVLALRPLAEEARVRARREMLAKHGDMLNDGSLADRAKRAVANEARQEVLDMEARALRKMQREVEPFLRTERQQQAEAQRQGVAQIRSMAGIRSRKQMAEGMIAQQRVRDLRPATYMAAARRAGKQAVEAAARKEYQTAAVLTERQALNLELYKAASQARERAEKTARHNRRYLEKSYQERLGKAGASYQEQMNNLLEQYDFRRVSNKQLDRRASYRQWVEQQQAQGIDPHVDEQLMMSDATNYRDLTVDQLDGLRDMLDSIYHLARYKNKLLNARAKAERDAINVEIAEWILDHNRKPPGKKRRGRQPKWRDGAKKFGKAYMASLLNADTLLRDLGGYDENSPLYRFIKGEIDRAVAEKLLPMKEKAGEDITALYDAAYTTADLRRMRKENYNDALGREISKEEALAVALNWGSEGNRQAVLDAVWQGEAQYTQADVDAILDSLDERDWKFVQSVWDYISDEYWPQLTELYQRRKGVVPKKVEGVPVQTKFGEFKGGYYPLQYDPEYSFRVKEEEADEIAQQVTLGRFAWAQTKQGFMKERIGSGGKPIKIDLSTFHKHINDVIQTIALSDVINDAQHILASKPVTEAMNATDNVEALRSLDNWLKDTAAGEIVTADWISRASRHLRVGFTMSKLAWNINTILIQWTGLAQTMASLDKKSSMIKGMQAFIAADWFGENSVFNQIDDQSAFMRSRKATFNKDIMDTMAKMKGGVMPEWLKLSFFGGIVYTQRFVDIVTYLAGLDEAHSKGVDNPVQYAERLVARSQASGIWTDRTPIERGTTSASNRQSELVRSFTALGSYMFIKANRAYEQTRKRSTRGSINPFKNPVNFGGWVVDMAMLFMFETAFLMWMHDQWPDEDDDESKALAFAKEVSFGVMGSLPIIRELGSELQGFRGGGVWGSTADALGKMGQQIGQGEVDGALLRSINNVGGIMFHYPSAQTNRTLTALAEDMAGEDVEPIEYLLWQED